MIVDLFSVYLLSHVDSVIRYIEVDFTFGLPDYVRYIEEFVISRFVISRTSLNRGSLNRGSTVQCIDSFRYVRKGIDAKNQAISDKQHLTRSLRSLVRYCFCHSNMKLISSRYRVTSSMYITVKSENDVALCDREMTRIAPMGIIVDD